MSSAISTPTMVVVVRPQAGPPPGTPCPPWTSSPWTRSLKLARSTHVLGSGMPIWLIVVAVLSPLRFSLERAKEGSPGSNPLSFHQSVREGFLLYCFSILFLLRL